MEVKKNEVPGWKRYNDTFREKNKERINTPVVCPECSGSYKYFSKAKHLNSMKHRIAVKNNETILTLRTSLATVLGGSI